MIPNARSKAVGRHGPVGKHVFGQTKSAVVTTTTALLGNGSDAPSPSFRIPQAIVNGSTLFFTVLSWDFMFGFGGMFLVVLLNAFSVSLLSRFPVRGSCFVP